MPFLGTIVNFFVVIVCGIAGSFVKTGIPERMEKAIVSAMAVCVIYIGIGGTLETAPEVPDGSFFSAGLVKVLVMIVSMAIGTVVGELIDIDRWLCRLGDFLESKFTSGAKDSAKGNFARGFVSCSLLFCVGAMAVNGALDDAMCKPDTLLAKSVIDGITCFVMASSLGFGCAFSAFTLLVYQGAISLLGLGIVELLPAATISYMSVTGSLIIILIGTNMLGCTKVKTANLLPAIFMPIFVAPLIGLL